MVYIFLVLRGGIINCKSVGNNCKINSGVVVGSKQDNTQIAEIGDNVELAVGCKVIEELKSGIMLLLLPMRLL